MYTLNSLITYSQVDNAGRISLSSLVNYFQDAATLDGESCGVGLKYLISNHMSWLLSYWQIVFDKMPMYNDKLEIKSIPYEIKGPFGHRCFLVKNYKGEVLVRAYSLWTLADMSAGKALRVPPEIANAYITGPKIDMDYEPRKLKIPEGGEKMEAFQVGLHMLDTNQHVNNAQYVNIAQNYLPKDFEIGQMRVEYKAQAKLGDTMVPRIVEYGDRLAIALEDENGSEYAAVEFRRK